MTYLRTERQIVFCIDAVFQEEFVRFAEEFSLSILSVVFSS